MAHCHASLEVPTPVTSSYTSLVADVYRHRLPQPILCHTSDLSVLRTRTVPCGSGSFTASRPTYWNSWLPSLKSTSFNCLLNSLSET